MRISYWSSDVCSSDLVIMEHFTAGRPVMAADAAAPAVVEVDDDELVTQIKDLLDTRVRPAVAKDGGDIIFQIGRSSRRERVCQYVEITVVAGYYKKKTRNANNRN